MRYEERVLAFIDVLGFSNKIRDTINHDTNEEIESETDNIYKFFEEAQELLHRVYPDSAKLENNKVVNHFSDSIVISYPVTEEAGVFHILAETLFLCNAAFKYKILFRGAIVCGKLYHKEDKIFGPALVTASEMEKNLAVYPRIILDNNILDIAEKHPAKWLGKSEQSKVKKSLISKDLDGLQYINCFDGINYIVGEEAGILSYFRPLGITIEELKSKGKKSEDQRIKSKYLWLKEKYNKILLDYKKNYDNEKSQKESPKLYDYLKNSSLL